MYEFLQEFPQRELLFFVAGKSKGAIPMKNLSVKKLALAGMLCALAVVGSVFSFPIFGSKCAPV